jgi:hypothetical protein
MAPSKWKHRARNVVSPAVVHRGRQMDQAGITASPKLRFFFVLGSIAMLALWGLSLIPAIKSWGDPNEDGFSYVPVRSKN